MIIVLYAIFGAFVCLLFFFPLTKFLLPGKEKQALPPLSSKIKNLFIELHNYTFFHSPEGTKKSYNRYVGRIKLREKLKTILTNSETRSGAYLITGFRGMGKTSLVRKAISEIKGNHYYALSRHIRLFLSTVVIYLFHSKIQNEGFFNPYWVFLFLIPLTVFGILYLLHHDNNRPNVRQYYARRHLFPFVAKLKESLASAVRILDPEVDYYSRSKVKALLQDIILLTLMYSVFFVFAREKGFMEDQGLLEKISWLFFINLTYFLVTYFHNNYQLERREDPKKQIFKHIGGAFVRIFSNAIKRLDYGNKVAIEVSLSQDDLKEIDILKLLAKKIHSEYKSMRNRLFAPNRIAYPIITFFTTYLLVGLTFYYKPVYNRINEFRLNSGIIQYFPSQAAFPYVQKDFDFNQLKKPSSSQFHNYVDSINTRLKTYFLDSIDTTQMLLLEPYYEGLYRAQKRFNGISKEELDTLREYGIIRGKKYFDNLSTVVLSNSLTFEAARRNLDSLVTVVPQIRGGTWSPFRHFLVTCDFIIQAYYQKFFYQLISQRPADIEGKVSADFRFLPALLDYYFILTLFIILLLILLVRRNAWRLGLVNHSYILKRLRFLNENISAQIVQENGRSVGVKSVAPLNQVFNFFSRRSKTYPIAGVREIENELIDILNEVDKIPSISMRPEFIFVFDELDKIEAQFNVNIQDKESEELASFNAEDEGYFSTESIRRRQETIARILGNLKLFFNTARAKFIFIAGREMYDASLADISDRESFISSIFHEILYVESFFKDSGSEEGNDITSTTEEFICQLLMPRFSSYPKSLKGYNEYLKEHFSRNSDLLRPFKRMINEFSSIDVFEIEYAETEEELKIRRKVIYTLSQFITFLTYRGNGAPKKITKLLEGFITTIDSNATHNNNAIFIARNDKNLYLYFDYTCQYRLGLTTHLFKPYLIANSGHMRDFGDKMLIATSFLMDHIYKYHKVGFSWENLELTPEIIAINKSPELRRFISRLIDFMASSHIEEIINGLHQFKFTIRIASEIKYISTISEVEAAAFNFTLDESLLLKRHYRKKLRSLEKTFEKVRSNSSVPLQHINSIAYINTVLADLHFYDREYDEALIHYENAAQFLSTENDKLAITDFIFLIRHLLKVGLTYEKTRDYDSAFISYGRITQMLRNFCEEYDPGKKEARGKTTYKNKEKLRIQRKLLENVNLIFEPMLAQFQVVEKGGPNGVTSEDVIRIQDEFKLVIQHLESSEKFLIETEFYNKIGDILFYKNGVIPFKNASFSNDGYSMEPEDIQAEREYLYAKTTFFNRIDLERDYKVPFSAWKLYVRSAKIFASRIESLKENKKIVYDLSKPEEPNATKSMQTFIDFISGDFHLNVPNDPTRKELKLNKQTELLVAVGSNLSDMADTLICFLSEEDRIEWSFLSNVLRKTMIEGKEGTFSDQRVLDRLREELKTDFEGRELLSQIFIILFTANQYFLRAGDYYRGLFQLKKILILIRRVLDLGGGKSKETINKFQYELIKTLAIEAMEIADQSTKHTRRQQVYEWENYFSINAKSSETEATFLDSILNHPEGKEIYTIVKEIELHLEDVDIVELLKKNQLATPFSIISNKYNRMFELSYKCTLNHHLMSLIRENSFINDDLDIKNHENLLQKLVQGSGITKDIDRLGFESSEDVIRFLISDSIYSLSEIIRALNVFGVSYMSNHSTNAMAHEHLGIWCYYYQTLQKQGLRDVKTERFVNDLRADLVALLGKLDAKYLDIGYHFKVATQYYYSALEVHNGGNAYNRAIEEMHYLDDDFDDNLSHFCASIERYRINSGFIRRKIKKLKDRMDAVDRHKITDFL